MVRLLAILKRLGVWTIIFFVRGYQAMIRPLLVGNCKFIPTCSEYCIEAVNEWGPLKGGWLALKRIGRCTPFTRLGGIDPVPKRRD